MNTDFLIGSWLLLKHGFYETQGKYISTGSETRGQLIYASDGSMSVLILKTATPTSLHDMIAYAGTFSATPHEILHHIHFALKPEREGTSEKRFYEFKGNKLTLRTEPDERGHYEIVWQKNSV